MRSYSYVYYIVSFSRKKFHREYKEKKTLRIFALFLLFRMKKMVVSSGLSEPRSQGRGVMAPPDFGKSVSPISTGWEEGDRFMPTTLLHASPTWIFITPYGSAPVCAKREI